MTPTTLRTPIPARGDIPDLLRRSTPTVGPGGCLYVFVDGRPDPRHCLDWTDLTALVHAALWLESRNHPAAWMLPERTLGGTVPAWDGLTAHQVSAVLLSVSVARVGEGRGAIQGLCRKARDLFTGVDCLLGIGGVHAGYNRFVTDNTALLEGAALLVPGGVMVAL